MAFLSWILLLAGAILALLLRPYDRFVQFHAKQSIIFSIIVIILHILLRAFMHSIFFFFIWWLAWLLGTLLIIGALIIGVLMGIKAWQGEWTRLPI